MSDLEVIVQSPELISGKKVVIVGDGPTLTHGGMSSGAGTVAAQSYGVDIVDPQSYAIGDIKDTFKAYPHLEHEIPAMGYTDTQVRDLEATLENVPADVILDATPVDLSRRITVSKPLVSVEYRFAEQGDDMRRILESFVVEQLD